MLFDCRRLYGGIALLSTKIFRIALSGGVTMLSGPGNFEIFPLIHRLDKKRLNLYYPVVLTH
jgi:hypothetical protein